MKSDTSYQAFSTCLLGFNDALGKIMQKTDIGNYVYDNQKIHQLKYLTTIPNGGTDPAAVIGTDTRELTYTSFLKTATITEASYELSYTYGSDRQRLTSTLKQGGNTIETKTYWGDVEVQVKGGTTREIYYIAAGNGLNNIIVAEGSTISIYYAYTDQLGSIVAVTDEAGTIVAEQNFDAWGRYRNPADWSYNNIPTNPDWLYRGFTGHEHITVMALINMNGRMYDPMTALMLSPDNYVPMPFSPGGYNRYIYANGNPLKFVDPDGEFFWLIPIAAAVFGVGNTVAHAIKGDINSLWDGLKYFGQGAIAGAALGTGIGYGLTVPILSTAIKGAAWAYAGSTILSAASGIIQGVSTGDWTALGNAGKIFLGNFYLDENKNFFGGVLEGVSRFSWQLPQSTIGHAAAAMINTFGAVRSVGYYGGATAVETNAENWGGVTQGSFVIGARGLRADPNNPLFQHEYGHYIQSQTFGLLYYGKAGIPSLLSRGQHNLHPVEQDANGRAIQYFNKKIKGFSGWDYFENPILNPNFRLRFNWYDPFDLLGIINSFRLNKGQ